MRRLNTKKINTIENTFVLLFLRIRTIDITIELVIDYQPTLTWTNWKIKYGVNFLFISFDNNIIILNFETPTISI